MIFVKHNVDKLLLESGKIESKVDLYWWREYLSCRNDLYGFTKMFDSKTFSFYIEIYKVNEELEEYMAYELKSISFAELVIVSNEIRKYIKCHKRRFKSYRKRQIKKLKELNRKCLSKKKPFYNNGFENI